MIKGEKYGYVHIPRTGGQLLEHMFQAVSPSCELYTDLGLKRHDTVDVFGGNQFLFTTLRSPFNYYLSSWKHESKRVWSLAHPLIFQKGKHYEFPYFVDRLFEMKGSTGKGIYDFKKMHRLDIGLLTYRFFYQCCDHDIFYETNIEKNWKDYKMVGHVIWLENYRMDLKHMFQRFGEYFDFDPEIALLKFDSLGKVNASNYDKSPKKYHDENPETAEKIKHKERIIYQVMEE